MKTTIVTGASQPTKEIDWSKPEVLSYTDNFGRQHIVLSTGCHNNVKFEGVCLVSSIHKIGCITSGWVKKLFTPLTSPITITFEND